MNRKNPISQVFGITMMTLALMLTLLAAAPRGAFAADSPSGKKSFGINLQQGEVAVKVAKMQKTSGPLMVKTPSATMGVRGTEFTVAVDAEGKSDLHVLEGQVAIINQLGEVLAKAGEAAVILQGVLPQMSNFDIAQYRDILNLWEGGITVGKVRDFVKAQVKKKVQEEVKKKLPGIKFPK